MATALSTIEDAFAEIRVKKAGVDLQTDEISTAIRKLNGLMTEWDVLGIHLGFRKVASSSDETGIPDWAENATVTTLAMRLAATFGKLVSQELNLAQNTSFLSMLNRVVEPVRVHYPGTLPIGSGNDHIEDHQSKFFTDPSFNDLDSVSDGALQTEEGFSLDTDIESEALE